MSLSHSNIYFAYTLDYLKNDLKHCPSDSKLFINEINLITFGNTFSSSCKNNIARNVVIWEDEEGGVISSKIVWATSQDLVFLLLLKAGEAIQYKIQADI